MLSELELTLDVVCVSPNAIRARQPLTECAAWGLYGKRTGKVYFAWTGIHPGAIGPESINFEWRLALALFACRRTSSDARPGMRQLILIMPGSPG